LCREVFLKENALSFLERGTNSHLTQTALHDLFGGMRDGTAFGLHNLMRQKAMFDASLRGRSFADIKSVLFCSEQSPIAVFSSVFFPEFDFRGTQLQDLGDHSSTLDLISFSFGPMEDGWGLLFAWHADCSKTCVPFMESLATVIHEGGNPGDSLFRFVVSNCENIAMRPQWWESLTEQQRNEIAMTATYQSDVFSLPRGDQLVRGLENISHWQFEEVISDMD
jgi:hypothetical protein